MKGLKMAQGNTARNNTMLHMVIKWLSNCHCSRNLEMGKEFFRREWSETVYDKVDHWF